MSAQNGPPPGALVKPILVAPKVISSTVLGMVSWWLGSHGDLIPVKDLVVRSFKADDVYSAWCKLREASQLAAGNPVLPPPRHRTDAKLAEELVKDVSENEKNDNITLLVPSSDLGVVRGRMEGNLGDDRPVAARLESLEDMMKGVVDKLAKMESNQDRMVQAPQIQVQPPVVQQPVGIPQHVQGGGQQQSYAAAAATGLSFTSNPLQQLLGGSRGTRRNSVSVKRSVSGAVRDHDGNTVADEVFTEVNKKKKKKEISTGTSTLQSIPGVQVPLQASYQHFVGNTPGNMEKDTLELVLRELAVDIMKEKGIDGTLEVEDCNLLTREQNTRTRVWRVVVPHRFKDVLQDDRLYPTGWHHREFEGHYRPPLTPQERAERDAKKLARQQNDNRLGTLLRQLAGHGYSQAAQ